MSPERRGMKEPKCACVIVVAAGKQVNRSTDTSDSNCTAGTNSSTRGTAQTRAPGEVRLRTAAPRRRRDADRGGRLYKGHNVYIYVASNLCHKLCHELKIETLIDEPSLSAPSCHSSVPPTGFVLSAVRYRQALVLEQGLCLIGCTISSREHLPSLCTKARARPGPVEKSCQLNE